MNNHAAYLFPEKLNKILTTLCAGVDLPKRKEIQKEHEAQRLIEFVEKQKYPYSLVQCEHKALKGISEDCVDCQFLQYETYKSRFISLAKEKTYDHTHTLQAAFEYYASLITQYRLTECDELLTTIYPYCKSRSWSDFYFMAIQALSFLRFKQGRYKESLEFFNTQIQLLGPNERIYENMALAHSRLQENYMASVCYAKAILLIREKSEEEQEYSTLLLGLHAVLDNTDDALTVLDESMKLLQQKYDKPHSLMAKTLTSMGDLHLKQNNLPAAEKCYSEAVTIFIDTCGYETPLTSKAMNKYASILLTLGQKQKAVEFFIEALKVWVKVDNESFEPHMVAEALMALMNNPVEQNNLKEILESLQNKISNNAVLANDLNVLCLLKFIYELLIMKGELKSAAVCCEALVERLSNLDEGALGELIAVKNSLLQESDSILKMIRSVLENKGKT
jgi:tetratricopeptide (TPR) repeat protein